MQNNKIDASLILNDMYFYTPCTIVVVVVDFLHDTIIFCLLILQ